MEIKVTGGRELEQALEELGAEIAPDGWGSMRCVPAGG